MRKILLAFLLVSPAFGQTIPGAPFTSSGSLSVPILLKSSAYQNIAFSTQMIVSGGKAPYTWSVSSGSLPTGLSLGASSGAITGTPIGSGASIFTVSVQDSSSPSIVRTSGQLAITVNTLVSITLSPSGQSIKTGTTLQLAAQGTWLDGTKSDLSSIGVWACSGSGYSSITTGGLFTASGSVGTPSCTNTFDAIASAALTITVGTSTPTIQNSSLCNGQIGQQYPESSSPACVGSVGVGAGVQLSATGGTPPYTWSITAGALQTGLTLSSTGLISGTPSVSGSSGTITFKVIDSASISNSTNLTLTVASLSSITVLPASPSIASGATQQFSAAGTYSDSSTAPVTVSGSGGGGSGNLSKVQAWSKHCTSSPCSVTVATVANDNIHAGCMVNGTGGPPVIADSALQSWTPVGSVNTGSGLMESQQFVMPTSAALTSITCSGTGSPSGVDISIYDISGEAPSSPLDAVAGNVSITGNVSSLTTGAITTSNATDILFNYTCIWSPENTVTPGSGYLIDSNSLQVTTSGHVGCAFSYQIVSSVQTAITTQTSWLNSTAPAQANFAAFKAASGGSPTGWSSSNTNVSTVNSSGLATANQAGTTTIEAAIGAVNGTSTLTVTGGTPVDTSLVVSNGSCTTGGTAQFSATGNITGNSYTNGAQWTVSPSSLATINNSGLATCGASTGSGTVTAVSGSLHGSGTLTIQSASGNDLLLGCVVSGITPSCSTPAGWTLKGCQGFDTGSVAGCVGGVSGGVISSSTSINSTKGHTGCCSVATFINGDGYTNQWYGSVSGHEAYLSEWDWGGGGGANEEYMLFHATVSSPTFEEFVFDLVAHTGVYNDTCPNMVLYFQGAYSGNNYNLGSVCYFTNVWSQWEFHWLANTPGNSNGAFQVWLNGVQVVNLSSQNFNSTIDMTGSSVQGGGYYSKNVWTNNGSPPNAGGTCVGFAEGSESGHWTGTFNASPLNAANCPPAPPAFERYTDDIILLGK